MTIREIAQHFHNFCQKLSHRFPSFLIAFAQMFPLLLPEFREKAMGIFLAKAMRKRGKWRHIFRAKIIAFARNSHCFCPNFPLFLPEFLVKKNKKIGGTVPPPLRL